MPYTYKYPRLALTVDAVIFTKKDNILHVLLIQRDNPPFEREWALPGGFVDMDETLDTAAKRELEEETGITDIELMQLYTFGAINRDPRGRTVSVVYYGFVDYDNSKIKAGSDARNVQWFTIKKLPKLAFDHKDILELALKKIADIGF